MRYARLTDVALSGSAIASGVVAEILPDGLTPAMLPDDIARTCTTLPDEDPGISEGWLFNGGTFSAPHASALPERSVQDLAALLIQAATAACSAISRQVVPDDTHQVAYTNAATILWGNGGKAPTEDPAKSVFAAQAAALGLSVDTFASVVTSVSLVSLQLGALLSTVRGAANAAKSAGDLSAVLTAFEDGISGLVAQLNGAGLTVTVEPPDAIAISGLNT